MGYEVARHWRLIGERYNLVCSKFRPETSRGSWEFEGTKEPVVTEELLQGMVKNIKDEQMKVKTLEGYRKQLGGFMKKNGSELEDFGGGK